MKTSLFVGMVLVWCVITPCAFADVTDESMPDFMNRVYDIMRPMYEMEAAERACVQGNDNACIRVGVDPRDGCRRYVGNSVNMYLCRIQQCNAGNKAACRTVQVYEQQVLGVSRTQQSGPASGGDCNTGCFKAYMNCGNICRGYSSPGASRSSCNEKCNNEHSSCKTGCR
jgi:hypothetical protein